MAALLIMATKVGIVISSVIGVAGGFNWMNKKTFTKKGKTHKGGSGYASNFTSENFNYND